MGLQELGLFTSMIALVISVISLIRTRKYFETTKAQSEYSLSPKLTLGSIDLHIESEGAAFEAQAILTSHSQNAVKLIEVCLEYGDKSDQAKRSKIEIIGATYLSEGQSKQIKIYAPNSLAERVIEKYGLSEVHYWITVVLNGIYGQEISTRYHLLHFEQSTGDVCTRCSADHLL